MSSELKQKTVSGLFWSLVDNFATYGLAFVIGVILARLLTPSEFGLIGMIMIFIALSRSVIDSGFSQALIRKKECSETDYSTVFYFNLAAGAILFGVLFWVAPYISSFFNEPRLTSLVRVLGVVLVIDALTIIQRTILTRRLDFKLQTKISVVASLVSGAIAIIMAYRGFGVWSLVARQVSQSAFHSLLLWFWNQWRPVWGFSKDSFRELFSFGSKLLVSGLIDTAYRNIYYLVIGKYFSATELGYFTRAEQFKNLPSQNLSGVISRVSFPVLASIQDDLTRLKDYYRKLIRSTMFLTFVLMLGLSAVAKPTILVLIGEKWRPSIIYLQMLCFVGMFYPLNALNLNMLKVKGRSDLFLRLEVIKKVLAVPTIIAGILWGIKVMIAGMMVNAVIAYYLNSYWSGQMIGYPLRDQVKDILPSFLIAVFISVAVFLVGQVFDAITVLSLTVQLATGTILTVGLSELIRFRDYLFLKNVLFERLVESSPSRDGL
ncbi:MAG: MOP flippase family protein [Desulfuromonadales bacterium]|jgi:teichuronic acid exporter